MSAASEGPGPMNFIAIGWIIGQLALTAFVLWHIHKQDSIPSYEKWLWTALGMFVPFAFFVWFGVRFWARRSK